MLAMTRINDIRKGAPVICCIATDRERKRNTRYPHNTKERRRMNQAETQGKRGCPRCGGHESGRQ